jgi:menaquinone-9 beta-reductase
LTDFPREVDVLIAGAGPAGSAVAGLLADSGLSVLAVDRAAFPRDKPCSEYMSPEAVRILSRLGALDALEQAGAAFPRGTKVIASKGASLHGVFDRASHQPYRPTGLAISRRVLDQELLDQARRKGALVRERTAVEELLYESGGVAGALLRDAAGQRHPVRARLTIGADGLRSVVARRIGRRSYGFPRRVAFVAHMTGVEGTGPYAELHVNDAGYVGLNPIGADRTNVALVIPAASVKSSGGRVKQFFAEQLERFPQVAGRLVRAEFVRPLLATGPFAAWSGRVIAPGAALVGDAADFFDPFTGEGIYSALRGAELLADTARQALAVPGAITLDRLRPYQRSRRRVFTGKWLVERMIGYGMIAPALFNHAVARLGRRAGMAHTLIGVTGDFVPAREVLNPRFLARMLL